MWRRTRERLLRSRRRKGPQPRGPERQHRRTQRRATDPGGGRIRQAAERNPASHWLPHITPVCTGRTSRHVAAGIDGVTWAMWPGRAFDLHRRLHSGGAYRAPPVRRVEIPKPDGDDRRAALIVQKAVVNVILTPIYRWSFLVSAMTGEGGADALDALAFGIERRKVDCRSPRYFDTIPLGVGHVP